MADDGGKEWALSGLAKEHVENSAIIIICITGFGLFFI